ncbi:MAG: tRNA (adenosine(37)-N6)-threonylcarbamoyltransferase complex dimerization subunit type 1 TsaB [Acidobacteria bacterium]|nr:tRNA (adenosine(37)-N6)-threonylcarbamoyltransferase complex dimerization subunit type 1 TsaB [Acidobacteriota bacterium]
MILAIDTTHEIGSIALVDRGIVLKQVELGGQDGFGHLLFEALRLLDVPLNEVDGFAAARGPGTFTGVRIGLTAVKGLAEAMGKPAYGVSNLDALLRYKTKPTAVPLYDARRGDVYARLLNGEEVVTPLAEVRALVGEEVEWVSFAPIEGLEVTPAPKVIAGAIGLIAEERWNSGDRPDPAALDANYVRRTDAELNWREA